MKQQKILDLAMDIIEDMRAVTHAIYCNEDSVSTLLTKLDELEDTLVLLEE